MANSTIEYDTVERLYLFTEMLFDGQTKELLVNVSSKKGDKRAFIKDGELNLLDYGKALERMAILMADDRNPAVSSTH